MDEATSALDSTSQQAISSAHRLATIEQADQIVLLEHHKAAESGSWDELISHG